MTRPTIIFDMDGTLLDLAYDDFIWNELLPQRYAQTYDCSLNESTQILNDFYQQYHHTLNWYSSKFWTQKIGIDVLALQIEYQHRVAYREGCLELLKQLNTEGYHCWLATNADCAGLEFKLKKMNIAPYFDVIISSETLGAAKESAEFWQKLQALHYFNPQNCYFIDDTERVLDSAQQFGVKHLFTIAQPSSHTPKREVSRYPMLHQLTEFMDYLKISEDAKQHA